METEKLTKYQLERKISEAIHKQRLYGLNSRLMIDCAHGNYQKDTKKQRFKNRSGDLNLCVESRP